MRSRIWEPVRVSLLGVFSALQVGSLSLNGVRSLKDQLKLAADITSMGDDIRRSGSNVELFAKQQAFLSSNIPSRDTERSRADREP